MPKNKGQINIGIALAITTLLAGLISTSLGISWRANDASNRAIDKISVVEGDIKSINTNINGMNEKLDLLMGYFKLTPKLSESNKTK